jgi:DNA-binding NtrC family response regulator
MNRFPGMKKALLLDDDSAQLSVRQLLLERMGGIESQTVTAGRAALDLLRSDAGKASIGVVVTDHIMPDMDGPEFVREVRSFDPHIPVIVVSGLPDADIAYEGLNVHFLMKPCEPSDLIAVIRSALNGQRPRASA